MKEYIEKIAAGNRCFFAKIKSDLKITQGRTRAYPSRIFYLSTIHPVPDSEQKNSRATINLI